MAELCSNCNKPLRPGSKFCGYCGTPVKTERRCKKCNELLEYDERFCPMCGERYEDTADLPLTGEIPIICQTRKQMKLSVGQGRRN